MRPLKDKFKLILSTFFLFVIALTITQMIAPSTARASDEAASKSTFDRGVLRAWQFSNAAGADVIDGTLHVKGWWDPTITIPLTSVKAQDNYILKVTAKTSNPMSTMQIRWKADGRTRFYPNTAVPLHSDGQTHTYTIDLRNNPNLLGSNLWTGTITQLTIAFVGFSDDIAIKAIELSRPSGAVNALGTAIKDFATPIGVKQSSINIIESPYLFTVPFIFMVNIIAILALICYIAFGLIRRRTATTRSEATIYSALLIAILAAWITYDLRLVYNDASTMGSITNGYLTPEENKRFRFYDAEDIHGFAKFIEEALPKDAPSVRVYLPRERAVYAPLMKYLLQPRTIYKDNDSGEPSPYHVVYKNPGVVVQNGTLYAQGSPIARGNVLKSFDQYSFIFMESSR